jgi:predicted unusual protein kinase regulating ubiquinone biosynthesis (AarF/ABC1/UbiB family)
MGSALVDLGFETREGSHEALERVAQVLLDVAKRLRNQTYLEPGILREAGESLSRLIRENPVIQIPSHVVLLVRVFGLLSGLGNTLGVKLDMLQTILPYAAGQSPHRSPGKESS